MCNPYVTHWALPWERTPNVWSSCVFKDKSSGPSPTEDENLKPVLKGAIGPEGKRDLTRIQQTADADVRGMMCAQPLQVKRKRLTELSKNRFKLYFYSEVGWGSR